MKIHFIFPRWQKLLEARPELRSELAGWEVGSFSMASLGIPTAAADLPPDVEVSFQDENMVEVDTCPDADLVGIGFFTPQASSAYRLADELRRRGKRTIAGGIHPTMAPEDTLRHFDSIVVGEVEGLWPRILGDLERGALAPRYAREGDPPPVLAQRPPRRELFQGSKYLRTSVVQVSRGCRHRCHYCVIPRCYGASIRYRPVAEVVEDIARLPTTSYYIADENFAFGDATDRAYANELLDRLIAARIPKVFYIAAYPWMLKEMDRPFMQRLRRAGCRQLYGVFGLDAPLRRELEDPALIERLEDLRESRIELMGSFMLGHDGDDPSSKELIVAFCERVRLNLAEFAITTPFPGTPQFAAMQREGRILHEEWGLYNCAHVVFRPRHFAAEELAAMYLDLWRLFYRGVDPLEMKRRYVKAFTRSILESDPW